MSSSSRLPHPSECVPQRVRRAADVARRLEGVREAAEVHHERPHTPQPLQTGRHTPMDTHTNTIILSLSSTHSLFLAFIIFYSLFFSWFLSFTFSSVSKLETHLSRFFASTTQPNFSLHVPHCSCLSPLCFRVSTHPVCLMAWCVPAPPTPCPRVRVCPQHGGHAADTHTVWTGRGREEREMMIVRGMGEKREKGRR